MDLTFEPNHLPSVLKDIFLVSLGIVSQWILDPFFSDVAEAWSSGGGRDKSSAQ